MDPINPIAGNPEALNQGSGSSQIPDSKFKIPADNHWMSILAMAIFVLFSLGVVAFLYYQNQQLKSMLASYQTPVVSPTPTATADPTANWEAYTDSKLNYSIKYPKNTFTVKATPGTGIAINRGPLDGVTVDFQILSRGPEMDPQVALKRETSICDDAAKVRSPTTCNPTTESFQVNNAVGIRVTSHPGLDYYLSDLNRTRQVVRITVDANKGDIDYETFVQILSTFKFTTVTSSGSPTPTSKACTLEAKVCPDGSSVGRTGPNCEFAPCPIP